MMSLIFFGISLLTLPSALAKTHDVSVGAEGLLRYNPEFITAAAGDIVRFTFHPKNHTVTQSSFDQPCVPLAGGFDSGFQPVATESNYLPTYSVRVDDPWTPIWVHCRQPGPPVHCREGMVFAINPPAEPSPHSFSAFKASAKCDSTPPAKPVHHKITVGADGKLAYNPMNISAAIGDTVTFKFHPKNHTVTQSSFSKPCQPLQDTTGKVGFASGFMPVMQDSPYLPTFTIKINDTEPIWGYCGQVGHCGQGMVFSINAVENGPNNFAAFQSLAKEINGTSTCSSSASSATETYY